MYDMCALKKYSNTYSENFKLVEVESDKKDIQAWDPSTLLNILHGTDADMVSTYL